MKKVVIIDDEAPARQLLTEYIEPYRDLVIIGTANNGVDAVKLINEFDPDLVFLDIQMPGLTGFEVIQQLHRIPNIIFSTAYDQFTLRAFEVNAVDYLLKPYTRERMDKAIQKTTDKGSKNIEDVERLARHLLEAAPQNNRYPDTVLVQNGNKLITINTEDIIWIGAEKDYSSFVLKSGKYLSNYGISAIEQKLDPTQFLRIHRSTIISIRQVAEEYKHAASYDIRMSNGDVVRVSRSYLDVIKGLTF